MRERKREKVKRKKEKLKRESKEHLMFQMQQVRFLTQVVPRTL